jgi:hypothetical protein
MFSRIQENICDRVADFAWGTENLEVITVAQHLPATPRDPVHRSRESRTERLHAAR